MARVFFTYIWGEPTAPAWPLTFATKHARRFARSNVNDGDFVFCVATRQEPTRVDLRGRVTGLYRLTDLELNTADYNLPRSERAEYDTTSRFPYALHPLQVWSISTPSYFSKLVGPLTPAHHLQAQSGLVELFDSHAEMLLALPRTEVLPILLPTTELGRGLVAKKNSKLAPEHRGNYSGNFSEHEIWYVYSLELKDIRGKVHAQKIGYSHHPEDRLSDYNKSTAAEVTGYKWHIGCKQPTASEEAARIIEQALLKKFSDRKLDSNGEIIRGGFPNEVTAATGVIMRALASST